MKKLFSFLALAIIYFAFSEVKAQTRVNKIDDRINIDASCEGKVRNASINESSNGNYLDLDSRKSTEYEAVIKREEVKKGQVPASNGRRGTKEGYIHTPYEEKQWDNDPINKENKDQIKSVDIKCY